MTHTDGVEVIKTDNDDFTTAERYTGKDLRVKSAPIIDPGVGKENIIRTFYFKRNPDFKGQDLTRQDIFNMHEKQIMTQLWGDGLTPRKDISPRVQSLKDGWYVIIVTAEPRMGVMVAEKAQNLTKVLQKGHKSLT